MNFNHKTLKYMKSITLTTNEINELVDLYEVEINRAERRIVALQSILKKLQAQTNTVLPKKPVEKESVAPKATVRKTVGKRLPKSDKVKVVTPLSTETIAKEVAKKEKVTTSKATPKKAVKKAKPTRYKSIKGSTGGVKMKWTDTIVSILREQNKPMLAADISTIAIERLGIDEANQQRAKAAIATNLTKLLKTNVVSKQRVSGQKGSLFGLVQ